MHEFITKHRSQPYPLTDIPALFRQREKCQKCLNFSHSQTMLRTAQVYVLGGRGAPAVHGGNWSSPRA